MNRIAILLCVIMVMSCQGNGVRSSTEGNKADTVPVKVSKFRYFDLSRMKGIEPYSGDSCVTVTEWGDSIAISVEKPKQLKLSFGRHDGYWHCQGEYFMKRDGWYMDGRPGPMRIDWIVRNDTLYKYEQAIYDDGESMGDLVVISGDKLEWSGYSDIQELKSLSDIFKIIKSWKDGQLAYLFSPSPNFYYTIIRTDSLVTFKPNEDNYVKTSYYPEIQIWGTRHMSAMENSLYDE